MRTVPKYQEERDSRLLGDGGRAVAISLSPAPHTHPLASNSLYGQDNLEFLSLLSSPSRCWGYRHVAPFPAHEVLRMVPMALYMLGKPRTWPF